MCSDTSETTAQRWQLASSMSPCAGCSSRLAAERRPRQCSASTGRPSATARRMASAAETSGEATSAATAAGPPTAGPAARAEASRSARRSSNIGTWHSIAGVRGPRTRGN
eukprot:3949776-Prymnesium_polylepis.2